MTVGQLPFFEPWNLQGRTIDFGRPVLMAICNVTPDSFYDGGAHFDVDRALAFCHAAVGAGAVIVDVGGESTRPGASPVDPEEEIRRVLPVVLELAGEGLIVSIDTTRAAVAAAALDAGACIVNDISGGRMDPEILDVAADHGAAMVLQHMRGTPAGMQRQINFTDVVGEVARELHERVCAAVEHGVRADRILVDPGIGFGKTPLQCVQLMAAAGHFSRVCDAPVLVGPSNKSFIGHLTGADIGERLPGTIASCLLSRQAGAHVFRVHDVAAVSQAFAIQGHFEASSNLSNVAPSP